MKQDVVFIVPRFHTNLLGWVAAIESTGRNVDFIINGCGHSEKNTHNRRRVVVTQRLLPRSWATSRNRFVRGVSAVTETFSLRELFAAVRSTKGKHVVLRFTYSLFAILFLILLLLRGQRPIIYTQNPLPLSGTTPQDSNRLRRRIQRHLGLSEISPVSIDQPEHAFRAPVLGSNAFIPFCVESGTARSRVAETCEIVCIGKFQRRKRHIEVVGAVASIRDQLDIAARLTIVGEVSTSDHHAYLDEVVEEVARLKAEDSVRILLNMSPDATQGILRESEIFVLFSHDEPASVSQLEAMANGLPVLIGVDNGTANYVGHGQSGYVVSGPEELHLYLLRLVASPELRSSMAADAIKKHKQFHSIEAAVPIWQEFLTSLEVERD